MAEKMMPEFQQTFFLSAGETNAEREMSLPLLTSKLIDIATAHANSLGIGNPAMEHLGCGWVLSRIAIEMHRYPLVNENYTLSTWVETWNRHFSVRNFCVSDEAGNPLGYATSVWMVLNTVTRENAGLSHLTLPEVMISGRKCPIERPAKHLTIVPEDYKQGEELPKNLLRATAKPFEYTFRYTDLDFYRHVNTVRYVSMLLNRFTLPEMDATMVKRLELSFMHECRCDETVTLLRSDSGLRSSFALYSPERFASGAGSDGVAGAGAAPAAASLFALVERENRS